MKPGTANWKGVVASVAPTVAGMLGGPLGSVAVNLLAEKLLDDPRASKDDVATALSSARVEDLNKLKLLEKDVRIQLKELGIREHRLFNDDRADARARQLASKDAMPDILAVLLTLGFFGVIAIMVNGQVVSSSEALMQVMLGSLSTAWVGSMQYFFGTTQSSRDKNQWLSR